MPTIILKLTPSQIQTIQKALAICESDMLDARDNSRSDITSEYYNRKMNEYKAAWDAVYMQVNGDNFMSSLDKALLASEYALDKV